MLVSTFKKLVLLVLAQTGLACYTMVPPPKFSFPTEDYIQVQRGNAIELKCLNSFPLKWISPNENGQENRTEINQKDLNGGVISTSLYESTFVRKAAVPEDTGYYKCISTFKHQFSQVFVKVVDIDTPVSTTEIIAEHRLLEVVTLSYEFKDDNFEITCRAPVRFGSSYHMYWQGPSKLAREKGQIHLQRLPVELYNGQTIAVYKMTVQNVTDKNNGEYSCTIIYQAGDELSASLFLSGHDVQILDTTDETMNTTEENSSTLS